MARGSRLAATLLRDPLILGVFALTVLACALLWRDIGSAHGRTVLFWTVQAALGVVFVVIAVRVARRTSADRIERRFFRRVALAGGFLLAGDLTQTGVVVADGDTTGFGESAPATVLVVVGAGCALWAMVSHPVRTVGRERLRFWLDAGGIMIGSGAVAWYLLWAESPWGGLSRVLVALLASGIMLVCGLGLVRMQLGGHAPISRWAGVIATVTALLAAGTTTASRLPVDPAVLGPTMALCLVPSALLALVPRVHEVEVRGELGRRTTGGRPHPHSPLPYAAVGATQVLLVVSLLTEGTGPRTWGIVAAVGLGTLLVMIRQIVAFADNDRLLASLDRAMLRIRQQERRFRALVQHASDITLVLDERWVITYASPATDRVLGVPPGELVGCALDGLAHPDDRAAWEDTATAVRAGPRVTGATQVRVRHAHGTWRWLQVVATNLLDDPSVHGIIGNLRDVTEERELHERLRHDATHDALTHLANRALFDERVRGYASVDGYAGRERIGVLIIDLDNFKAVNDTLGHDVGDGLLTAVAVRLLSCVEPADTVARLGGDEFAILLPDSSQTRTNSIALRILAMLTTPIPVEGLSLAVRASIGGAVGLRTEAKALVRVSDQAMYEAKRGGTGVAIRDLDEADPVGR